jgi:hypothetical protein
MTASPRQESESSLWTDRGLPGESFDSRHEIEMTVAAQEWRRVQPAQGGDPNVVGRNRCSRFFHFRADDGIRNGRAFIDVENLECREGFGQPLLIASAIARVRDAVPVFAQHKVTHSSERIKALDSNKALAPKSGRELREGEKPSVPANLVPPKPAAIPVARASPYILRIAWRIVGSVCPNVQTARKSFIENHLRERVRRKSRSWRQGTRPCAQFVRRAQPSQR